MEDFSGHVGSSIDDYVGVHVGDERGERNQNCEMLLEFADSFDMIIRSTFLRKIVKTLFSTNLLNIQLW